MELQRLDDITKDLCKLYGEFCCELADRAKTDDMATICALAKINDSLMDAIGGVRSKRSHCTGTHNKPFAERRNEKWPNRICCRKL